MQNWALKCAKHQVALSQGLGASFTTVKVNGHILLWVDKC